LPEFTRLVATGQARRDFGVTRELPARVHGLNGIATPVAQSRATRFHEDRDMAKHTPKNGQAEDVGSPVVPKAKRTRSAAPRPLAPRATAAETGTAVPADAGVPAPTETDIRERAYLRYLERGGAGGSDFDDWLEAERELRTRRK
jgi:hypothetical protein